MSMMSKLGMFSGLAAAAVLVYAQHRGEKTGRDVGTVLSHLPEELNGTRDELKRQLGKAVEAGRRAAADTEAQIDRQLAEEEPRDTMSVPEFDV
ncbi:MAG: hypothetical protein ACYC6B_02460 [Thermoleophilia bacterium]